MWIKRSEFIALIDARSKAEGEAASLREQARVDRVNADWMRMRITQVERERQQMMYAIKGIKIDAPAFEAGPTMSDVRNALTDLPSLDDVGDDMASALGIGWDEGGRVKYREPSTSKE